MPDVWSGASPGSLWDLNFDESLASGERVEAAGIFAAVMESSFKVCRVEINAILEGAF